MRSIVARLFLMTAAAASLLWLLGYLRAVWPFVGDFVPQWEFTFLTYPTIKVYRLMESSGSLSSRHIEFFSISDGPTGVEYTEAYFSCWIVTIGAFAGLLAGGYALFQPLSKPNG